MKLTTIDDRSRDGRLAVVSSDLTRMLDASMVAPTLQEAIEQWDGIEPALRRIADRLSAGDGDPYRPELSLAPLPRAWQWLDGSAFQSHGDLMSTVFGTQKHGYDQRPLMYQGLSDRFLPGHADAKFPRESDGIDFEGEFGVIVDQVPLGVGAVDALAHVKLLVLINDWSLRAIAPVEMKTGFGWIQAKPACSMAPVAVTPDELGGTWADGRVALNLDVTLNDEWFGSASGAPMAFGFDQLIVHAASTRDLVAGTIIGSGTVSNESYREVGSSCVAERRAIEMLDHGAAGTPFLRYGDRVTMEATLPGGNSLFGRIDQSVVPA